MPGTGITTRRSAMLGLAAAALAAGCVAGINANESRERLPKPYRLNGDGELVRPADYRTWVYVGTPLTPNDMNNGKAAFPEHHNVYIDPVSYREYLRSGTWRDGTMLVKELVSVGAKAAASGNGYFQGEFIGLEATIKSGRDFPDEPGNWAYFSFTNPDELGGDLKAAAAPFPAESCNACHAANARDDFVFTQHYPVLRAAKGANTAPENRAQRPKTLGLAPPAPDETGTISYEQAGRASRWRATQPTPATVPGTDVPTGQDALLGYLRSGAYRAWETRETARHPSAGPHTNYGKPVRVFMNDTLGASMKAGGREHPVGATAVKEMYTASGTLTGWAVEMKTRPESEAGDGWFWYEVTATEDGAVPVAIGNGVTGCVGCHAGGGRDLVRSTWPLR